MGDPFRRAVDLPVCGDGGKVVGEHLSIEFLSAAVTEAVAVSSLAAALIHTSSTSITIITNHGYNDDNDY